MPFTNSLSSNEFSIAYELLQAFTSSPASLFSTTCNRGDLQPLCFDDLAAVGGGWQGVLGRHATILASLLLYFQ